MPQKNHWKLEIPLHGAGFTLIELMVVITILAILSAIAISMYIGINIRARDAARLADFANIQQAIIIATHEDTADQSQILCTGIPVPCQESSYPVGNNTQNTDGTGWVKADFELKNNATFAHLPLDPLNTATHNYTYLSDGTNWRVETTLESPEYAPYMQKDGGKDPDKYEIGVGMKKF